MASKKLGKQEIRQELAKSLKTAVEQYAGELRELRKREIRRSEKKGELAKGEQCLLCGNPDQPGACTCSKTTFDLKKNEVMGYGAGSPATAGGMAKSVSVVRAMNGGTTQPKPKAPAPAPAPMAKDELCKCGKGCAMGKCSMDDVAPGKDLSKDELESGPSCPACSGPGKYLGALGNKEHFMCRNCGVGFSHDDAGRGASAAEKLMEPEPKVLHPSDKKVKKAEPPPSNGSGAARTLPHVTSGSGDKVAGGGSGGDIKKGAALKKDAMPTMAAKPSAKAAAPKLPGMTPKQSGSHPDVVQALKERGIEIGTSKPAYDAKANMADLRQAAAPRIAAAKAAGVPSPQQKANITNLRGKLGDIAAAKAPATNVAAVAAHAPAPITHAPANPKMDHGSDGANLKADMKAGGVGWLNSLVSKFKGAGNKTWEAMRGAGPATANRAARTAGARMALSEKETGEGLSKTSPELAAFELRRPTPGPVGAPAPQVNAEVAQFAPIAQAPVQANSDLGNCALCGTAEHPGVCTK